MSGFRRKVRRATARRTGVKIPERYNGRLIEKSVTGRTDGARCFDYEFPWKPLGMNLDAVVMAVHFRHPTKKRTSGRVCNGLFVQSAVLQREHAHG